MSRAVAGLVLLTLALCLFATPQLSAQAKPDALALYRQQRYSESIDVCLAEIEENSRNLDSYVVLCWSLVKAGRYEEAETWAARGRGISRYDPRLLEIAGEALYYQGKNERALELFQEYIAYASSGSMMAEVYDFMGETFLRMGKYRHADIAFSAALSFDSRSPERWVQLGYAREMAGEFRYSLDAYNTALSLSPNNRDASRGRASVISKMN